MAYLWVLADEVGYPNVVQGIAPLARALAPFSLIVPEPTGELGTDSR
ncbi:hypothetical protein METHB2_710007 [Candidatus Methylobacter favarea]|uniref:Uncharacterized protein n=1 Tax=Candidatus Methylobacter favarea TaxID=2707345 RepID=A0A8S0XIK6_9GAMM|nr:hypothetical protein METHB2_710007 [Candidatus Methylobacter favarea]